MTPTVGLSHDVGGWSYDGVFNQGRVVLNLKLRAEYDKKYFFGCGLESAVARRDLRLRQRPPGGLDSQPE